MAKPRGSGGSATHLVSAAYGLPHVDDVLWHEPVVQAVLSELPPELLVCDFEAPDDVAVEDDEPNESKEAEPPLDTENPKDVEVLGWHEVTSTSVITDL
jgi:hypothetical protein